ncbi:MAG: hypothetical protein GF329_00585, partial [Candidatus Lokiarchaeota archaeon]|nr:hypothetical protein [Candidatus Lokiarchaeota archaeon]
MINQKNNEKIGWIYGVIYDESTGKPIDDAIVCINSIDNSPISCYSTEEEVVGRYYLSAPIGIYTVTAKKSGYESKSSKNIQIIHKTAQELDFSLVKKSSSISDGDVERNERFVEYTIQEKVDENILAARLDLTKTDQLISYYSEDIFINLDSNINNIEFTIGSEEDIDTKIIVCHIKEGLLSNLQNIQIRYDENNINEISN